MKRLKGLILVSALAPVLAPSGAVGAQNRAGDPAVPANQISLKPGQTCWRYSGKEAFFKGQFREGEHLIVTSAGEAHEIDPATGREVARMVERSITVSQHQPYREIKPVAENEYRIPFDGAYDVSFWPHAIQGYPGVMIVCKR
jgi:hypothetical protein